MFLSYRRTTISAFVVATARLAAIVTRIDIKREGVVYLTMSPTYQAVYRVSMGAKMFLNLLGFENKVV